MDYVIYSIAGILCLIAYFLNNEDKTKAQFSLWVAVSVLASVVVGGAIGSPWFKPEAIHAAGMAFNTFIVINLISLRCRQYMLLCYLYPISIINELAMYLSLKHGVDGYFMIGQSVSWALLIAMVAGLLAKSDGMDGLNRYIRDHWRNHGSHRGHH